MTNARRPALPLVRFARPTAGRRLRSGNGRRALVVEDHMDVGGAFADCLRAYGLEVHVTQDGASALSDAAALPPAIAFVDLGLPDMLGREVGQLLRSRDADLVVVALTGTCDATEQESCLAAGFDCYVVKPIRMEVVEELLALVDERRRPATSRACDGPASVVVPG